MAKIIKGNDIYAKSVFTDTKKLIDLTKGLTESIDAAITTSNNLQKQTKENSKSQADLAAKTTALKKANTEVDAIEKERLKLLEKLKKANSDRVQSNEELKVQLSKQNKINKDLARSKLNLIGAYEKEQRKLKDLQRRYKDVAIAQGTNSKEAKRLRKEITTLNKKMDGASKGARSGKKSFGEFETVIGNIPGPIGGVVSMIQRLGKVLLASPIGIVIAAIGAAVGAMAAYFKNSEEGQLRWQQITAQSKATTDNLKDAFAAAGDALFNLSKSQDKFVDRMKKLWKEVKGLNQEAKDDQISALKLTQFDQKTMLANRQLLIKNQELRNQINKTRLKSAELASKRDRESMEERVKILTEAMMLEDEIAGNNEVIAKRRLFVQREMNKLSDSTIEDKDKEAELEVELLRVQGERYTRQKKLQAEISATQLMINNQIKAESGLLKKVNEDIQNIGDAESKFIEEFTNDIDTLLEKEDDIVATTKSIEEQILNEHKTRLEKQLSDDKEYEESVKRLKEQFTQEVETATKKLITDQFNAGVDDRLNSFLESQEAEEEALKNRLDKGIISEQEYEKQLKALRLKSRQEEAKAEKKKSLFDIAVNTAVAVVKALPNFIAAGLVAAIGAVQATAVASQPIPKFKQGGRVREDGMIQHTEAGSELFMMPDGTSFLSADTGKPQYAFAPKGTQIFSHDSPEAKAAMSGGMTPDQYNGLINEQRQTRKAIQGSRGASFREYSGIIKAVTDKNGNKRNRLVNYGF